MISTVFENEYVTVMTRRDVNAIVNGFNKTCDCNWKDDEICDECCSIDDLSFKLKDNPDCNIFVKFKDDWRWSARRYVNSISEYIEEELESDIELVKYQRKL